MLVNPGSSVEGLFQQSFDPGGSYLLEQSGAILLINRGERNNRTN